MTRERVSRRLAAVLVLDVAGYSRLMSEDEEGTLARMSQVMREVVEPRIAECLGRIVKRTGDGLLVEFASVVEATRCGVAIQREMARHAPGTSDETRLAFRIGINLGDIIIEPDEIYGDGVNIAARLQALAPPGGICVSATVAEQVGTRLDVRFVDLGEHRLKNIARPQRVFGVALGAEAAPVASAEPGIRVRPAPLPGAIPGFADQPVIAVLPFTNLGGDPGEDYFADGLTEDIITALACWRSFPVIARNSVFAYKGRNLDPRAVGRELGAQYLLEGSVRRQGSRVRITAQMIEAQSSHHVFADRYDRDVADVFAVQDEIEASILGALEPELVRVESGRAARAPESFTAYEFLQRGLWHHYRYTAEDNTQAQEFFRRSLAIEPDYVQAAAALAVTLIHRVMHRWEEDEGGVILAEATQLAQHAASLDQRSPHARYALALAHMHGCEIRMALREMQEVLRLHPSHAVAQANLGNLYNYVNRPGEALRSVHAAMRLSPTDLRRFIWMPALAASHYLSGRYDKAIEAGREGYAMKPDYVAPLRYVIAALGKEGRRGAAKPLLPALRRSDADRAGTEAYLRRYYVDEGALAEILDGLRRAGF